MNVHPQDYTVDPAWNTATSLRRIADVLDDDPIRAFARALLDGRVYLNGEEWTDRDGEHHWSYTIKVEKP